MKIIYKIFVKTKIFVCFLMITLMSIKRSPFETGIVFKTILKQRSIHSVYFYYVMSVKDSKFILAVWLVFCLFSRKESLTSRIISIGIQFVPKAYKRLPFQNLTKIWDLDFCIFNRGKIIKMRRVESFKVDG